MISSGFVFLVLMMVWLTAVGRPLFQSLRKDLGTDLAYERKLGASRRSVADGVEYDADDPSEGATSDQSIYGGSEKHDLHNSHSLDGRIPVHGEAYDVVHLATFPDNRGGFGGGINVYQETVHKPHDYSFWSSWGACSVTCGLGRRERMRQCHSDLSHCSLGNIETRPCLIEVSC